MMSQPALHLFDALNPNTHAQLMKELQHLSLSAQQVLYDLHEPSGFYVILEGIILLLHEAHTKRQILLMLKSDECFGGETLLIEQPSPYYAQAATDAQLLFLPNARVRHYLDHYPDFATFFLNQIVSRLQQLATVAHRFAFQDVSARLAGALLWLAEADGQQSPEGLWLPMALSQRDLADLVGTAREVISRTLKAFEAQGILSREHGAICIHDLEQLRYLSQLEAK